MRSLLLLSLVVVAACSAPPGPGPDPMPMPEPAPDPSITSFTVEKATITRGTRAKLTAVFAHGTATVSPAVSGPIVSGATIDTEPVTADTSFTLTVSAPDKTPVTATVQVHVVDAPVIASLTSAAPLISSGQSTQLTAVFTGGSGSIDHGIGLVTSGTPITTGALAANTTFTLTVTNAANDSVTQTVMVEVAAEPRIASFVAAKSTITRGSTAVLTAVFAGGTGTVDPGAMPISSGAPLTTAPLTADTVFTLTVAGPVGAPKTATVMITVVDAPVIIDFNLVDTDITSGQSAQLLADFTGGQGTVAGQGAITANVPLPTAPLTQNQTFVLTVTNAAGDSVTAMASVNVYPAPVITSFSPARATISTGQGAVLTAVFTDGTGVIDQGLGAVTSGTAATSSVFASVTSRTFTLTVTNPAGESVSAMTTVNSVAAPTISAFLASPTHTTIGQSVLLQGNFANGTASIDHGVGAVTGNFMVSSPPVTGATQFLLTVTNSAGDSVSAVANVTAVPPPVITSFTGVPAGSMDAGTTDVHLNVGQFITMTPVFTDGAGHIGPTVVTSGQSFTQNPATDTTYTLSVSNDAGMTVTANVNALIDHDVYVASDQGYVAVFRSHLDLAAAPIRKIYIQNCPLPSGVALQPTAAGGLIPAVLWVTCRSNTTLAARIMRIQNPQSLNNTAAAPATSSMTPISGAATLLTNPVSLAIDIVSGNTATLYVAESGSSVAPAARGRILVFAPNVGGNVAPVRTIEPPLSGDLTQLGTINAIATWNNELYVTSRALTGFGVVFNGISVFPTTWTGSNIAATRSIIVSPPSILPNGVAVSADGIYVTVPGTLLHFPLNANNAVPALHQYASTPGGQLTIFDKQVIFGATDQLWGHSTVDLARQWGASGPAFTLGVSRQTAVDPLR
ncbi:MAG: hypothetical protein U0228_34370 [Myxococcaceae bacterium]